MSKYISAHSGASYRKKQRELNKTKGYVSAHTAPQKNTGGVLGGLGYVGGKLGLGLGGVVEGVGDIVAAGGDLLRGDTEMAEYRFKDNMTGDATRKLDEWYNPGGGMQFVGDVASGVGQSSVFLLDALAPGLGTGLFFSGVTGQNIGSAAQQTGKVGLKEIGYGIASGATEAALGKLLGAGGKVAGKIGSSVMRSTGKAAGQRGVATALTKATGKKLTGMGWNVLKNTAKDAAGEFTEEFAAEYVDTGLLRLFGIDPNASTSFGEALRAGAVGLVSGAAMGAPANVYNYKNAVAAGRAIREDGGVDQLLYRAAATVDVLKEQEEQAREKGRTKATVPEDAGLVGKASAKGKQAVANLGAKITASKTKGYWDKLEKNINAYMNMDEAMRNSDVGDAIIGELRGNLYFTNMSYAVEEAEEALKTATDEEITEWLVDVNEKAKKVGQTKTDYTVEDFRANKDGILSTVAAAFYIDEIRRTASGTMTDEAATEKPVETEQDPKDTTAEQVDTQEENASTEDLSGIEEEVWRAVTDETVKGYGTQNEQEVALLRAAVSQNVPEKSIPLMLERFREGTDMPPAEFADAWADGVLLFGRLGLNEEKISQESALSRMSEKARHASIEYGKWLSEEQRSKEQEAAKKKKRPVKEGESRKPKGEVVRHPGINLKADLDDAQFTAYKAAEIMAPALNADIEIHKGLERNGKQVNGYYDTKTNTIHINIDAVRDGKHIALYTLGHEVAHYIKAWSPKKFYELGDYVMDQLGEKAEKAVRDKLDFMKRNGLVDGLDETEAYDRAYEEVVANGMELVLTDGTVLNELARENKTLWQKIKDRIFEIIEKIKKAYNDLSKTSRTAQILSETMDSLDEIEQLFYEGVTEAGERTRTAGVETEDHGEKIEVRYSVKTEYDSEKAGIADQIRNSQDKLNRMDPVYVSSVPNNVGNKEQGGTWAISELKKYGFRADRQNFGTIFFDEKSIRDAMNYLDTNEEKASIVAIFKVLKQGIVIGEHGDHKNRAKHTITFGAPVVLNGVRGNMAVVVNMRNNKYYVHRILMPDGSTFKFDVKQKDAKQESQRGVPEGSLANATSSASKKSIAQPDESVNRKFSISEEIPSTLSAEDQNLLFDADFYERYENESREPITETVQELETIKESEAFATMSDDEAFDLNAKLKAKLAGYDTVYDYYVETEKERMAEEYRRYVQTGRSNRTSRTLEEKRKKAQKERTLRSDEASATSLQNAQYKIIQETNPMWDEYHTGIRSPKEIKTFAEVAEDPESFAWGDFTKEDAQKALRDGSVRVYSSYAIKNGVFVSTSYKQALQYAGNNPDGVHTRVVALDSVAWINGDEGQYAKVYKNDIRYSIDETDETRAPFAAAEARMEAEAAARAEAKTKAETETEGDEIPDVYEIEDETPLEAAARRMREREAEERGDVWTLEDEDRRRQAIRDHELLADALMETAQSESEYRTVKNYKEKVEMIADAESRITELRKKTAELNREMDSLREKIKGVDKSKREVWVMTALDDATAQKDAYLKEMDELSEMIRKEEAKLLSLAAAKPLQKAIREANKRADAMARVAEKERQRADERVEKTRQKAKERADERVEKAKAEYEAREEYGKNRREMSVRERVARRVVGRMNTMFYNPTKTKHVPADLQALVEAVLKSEKLDTFKETRKHLRQMAEMEGEIAKLEQNPARTTKEQEKLDKLLYKYAMLEDEGLDAKSQAVALYTAFKEWMERKPKDQQDKALLEKMSSDIDSMEEMPLSNMSRKSLEAVETFYKAIYHQVNTANQAFATDKAVAIDEMSTKANTQVKETKALKFLSPRSREWAGLQKVREYLWKNMKPLTVFEAIGSDELMSIFKRVLDGEDVWITDILEAKKALDEAKKKYGYNKWNLKERREVTTADGSKVSLTLGEMMSLYAYMFREQAEEHLRTGGFVFAPDAKSIESFKGDVVKYTAHLNDQTPHRMQKEDIAKMSELLTEEQKAYAKRVQEYLTSLGAKGNEVSRKLYGIDLFKETAYFPIKSSHDYIETSTGKSGDPNIKSRGTFKETVPKAGNPIVLEDFMEVVGNHVNTMATYHAFVLPVEDLTRVWNYTPVNIKRDAEGKAILDENGMPVADDGGKGGYNSLKAEITKKYGKEANDYILQLLRDLNGGARRESAASILDKGLTAFKRSATMLSLSTIVQQPTSILRAMAYVDGRHFKGASFVPWETVKKYAPVAAIKEMGGFDTGTGARTTEYINAKQYDSIKDAAKAAVKPEIYGGDPNVRAEAFGWLTGKADEVSWRYMFGAIVNEQAEKLGKPKDSEEVLKAAGERFAEVVRRTQVYDSTLTRSEYMRSKDGLMKMATAFGAEPTTVVSMAVDAIIKAERGDKTFLRKSAVGIAFSIIANAAVASLIYAMRDDDEDETLPEKYVQSLTSELIEGFNPLEYLPIARDIMSMFKGYEIERSDMALIGNLMEQVELITSSKRSVPDKIFGVTGAVSAFFGLPVTNVYRDVKGLWKTGASFTSMEKQTAAGFGYAMGDAASGQFNLFTKLFGKDSGNAYELYNAYVKGDTAHYERVKARYETDKDAEMALRTELRNNDKRINQAAWAKHEGDLAVYESIVDQIESEGIFDRNIVIRAINNEVSEIKREIEKDNLVPKDETVTDEEETAESLYKSSDLNNALERGDAEDFAAILAVLVEDKVSTGKTEAQAKASVKSSITAYWKKQYLSGYQDTETRKRIIKLLTDTGMYGSRNDVATMCEGWVKNSK